MTGDFIDWSECKKKFIRKTEVDEERIKSLVEKAKQRKQRADNTKLTSKTVSFIVEDNYEVIKELLVAYLLKNGLKSRNHQCLISYFYMKNPKYEREALLISQLSFFRNRLNYYGEDVPVDFYNSRKNEINKIINVLLEILRNK